MSKDNKILLEELRDAQMKASATIDELIKNNPEFAEDLDTLRIEQILANGAAEAIHQELISEGGDQ